METAVFGKTIVRRRIKQAGWKFVVRLPPVEKSSLSHSQICLVIYGQSDDLQFQVLFSLAKAEVANVKPKFFFRFFRHMLRTSTQWNELDMCWLLYCIRSRRLQCYNVSRPYQATWSKVQAQRCQRKIATHIFFRWRGCCWSAFCRRSTTCPRSRWCGCCQSWGACSTSP